MSEYERVVSAVLVRPVGAAIYAAGVTRIEIDDEAAGPYVLVSQEDGKIGITAEEWPTIRRAIDDLLEWCKGQERPEVKKVPHD